MKRFHARREEKKRLIGRKRKSHPTVCTNCHHWKPDVNATGLCEECRPAEEDVVDIDTLIKPPRVIFEGYDATKGTLKPSGAHAKDKLVAGKIAANAVLFAMLAVAPGFAQTVRCEITGQHVICGQLGTPDPQKNLEVLKKHLESNVTDIRFGVSAEVPRSASTGSQKPTAGPWDFPPERPARRLDGTLLSDPVAVYGTVPYQHRHR